MIRVSIVDGYPALRELLACALDNERDMRVVAQVGTLADARGYPVRADVLILEPDLPDGDGAALISELCAAAEHPAVLVLSGSRDRRRVAACAEAGAAGALSKSSAGLFEIVGAVRQAAAGRSLFPPGEVEDRRRLAGEHQAERARLDELTCREREVLGELALGSSDERIAVRLFISSHTASAHVGNILRKLGVGSRLEALLVAARHGAVRLE